MHIAVLFPIALEKTGRIPASYINGVHAHIELYMGDSE